MESLGTTIYSTELNREGWTTSHKGLSPHKILSPSQPVCLAQPLTQGPRRSSVSVPLCLSLVDLDLASLWSAVSLVTSTKSTVWLSERELQKPITNLWGMQGCVEILLGFFNWKYFAFHLLVSSSTPCYFSRVKRCPFCILLNYPYY